jgi:hypothetical protein
MSQATIDYMKTKLNLSKHSSMSTQSSTVTHTPSSTHTIGIQTGSDDFDFSARLPNGRLVRLYHSPIYKGKVIGLYISEAKSFIFERQSWKAFKELIPIFDNFFKDGNSSK